MTNETATGQATLNLYLFAVNNFGSANFNITAKLYSCQIYDSETLVRNFIPCINPEGMVGLFDAVGFAFYGNLGTGSFTAGQKGA